MAILWIGLVAGTLDITDNLVFNQLRGITPWRVFQYIASVGGARGTAALHDCPHLDGYLLCGRTQVRGCYPSAVLSGLLYGGVVYLIMNFIVLPFSRVPQPQHAITLASRINGVLALLLCIGLTVSLLMRRTLFQARN